MIPQCIMPWVYLEIEPNGSVHPCCANDHFLGQIKTTSLEDIWNGNLMNEFRLSLLRNELPESCAPCKKLEELGATSLRNTYNTLFKDSFAEVKENTNQDGSLKSIKFKGYHFRVSSKCNFKCRMCDSKASSMFTGEIIEHTKELKFEEFVENNIEHFEAIGFAGGETLIMDEHYWLLQKLIDNGKTDVHLQYSTNMSTLKYKSHNVLEYWNKWNPEKLCVAASIDEIGERAEYIRKGTKWPIVEKNLKIISKQSFSKQITMVISCFNVFRLPEIIQHLTDIGYLIPENFLNEKYKHTSLQLYFVDHGVNESNLAPWILPENFKIKTKQKLNSFIKNYNLKYNTDIGSILRPIILFLNKETNANVVKGFLHTNVEMDKDRGENLFKTFPEFIEILDEWKKSGLLGT